MNRGELAAMGFRETSSGWVKDSSKKPGTPGRPRKTRGRVSAVNGPESRMNKLEQKYSEHLDSLLQGGGIIRWDFEPEKLRLANRTWYAPDFRVILPGGEIEWHEVKGFWEDDARVKIKVAAECHPYRFKAIQWDRKNKTWKTEHFGK